jgi:post-segregation antitoxin (ccd killing protein)
MNEVRKPRLDGPTTQTSVVLPEALLEQARSLAIDVSMAALSGLASEVTRALAEQWAAENSGAVEDWARYLHDNGQPFEDIQSRTL